MPNTITYNPCTACGCGSSTVTTACCANAFPTTLHATVNLDGSVAIVYDGSTYWLSGSITLSCGNTIQIRFYCTGSTVEGLVLDYLCAGSPVWSPAGKSIGGTCSPLNVTFTSTLGGGGLGGGDGCAACSGNTLSIEVTP